MINFIGNDDNPAIVDPEENDESDENYDLI